MGILTRFKDIMAANFNALLDKCEDPEKMVDQYIRDLEQDFAEVKAQTASLMAEEKSAKRKLNECDEEINRMTEYAKKAVTAGNDEEAKRFLSKKAELSGNRELLAKNYEFACENSAKMTQMHDKLAEDIAELKNRKETIKSKEKMAKTRQKINSIGSGVEDAGSSIAAFDRMEEKVNRMMDEADAMGELNKSSEDDIEELAKKYDKDNNSAVEDELAALKAQLGM